jgi:hypothetical protein
MPLPLLWPHARDWSSVDRSLGLPSDFEIRDLAKKVDDARKNLDDRLVAKEIAAREIGFFGQRAVCRLLNRPGNFEVLKHRGTRRASLERHDGMPIGVVTRQPLAGNKMPDLILRVREKPRDDLALVMVVWKGPEYEPYMPGWICEVELRDVARVESFRADEQNYVLGVSKLRPFQTLPHALTCREIAVSARITTHQEALF